MCQLFVYLGEKVSLVGPPVMVCVCFVYDVEQEISGMFIHYIKQIFYKQTRKGLVCMIIEFFLKVS